MAIDLDGDGIETIGVGTSPILFDHNADGIRTGTGWVRPDDAWLALDRNGNGAIDSGRELFGVDTLLSGTPGVDATYASTGFEALRTLDGNGDLVFNAQDAAFTQVRLWRDLNQDGISQASELTTLAAQGIASIALTPTTTTINLGNGNTVSGTATVTRSNGTTTHVDAVGVATDITAGNLNLANNPFYREFTTPVALTTTAQALPEMGGSGWVRDLREAMSLGTPQAAALTTAVQQFAAATTRDAQMALLDNVLRTWAETNQSRAMGSVDDPLRRFVLAGNATTSAQLQWALPILEVFNGLSVAEAGLQAPATSINAQGQTVQTFNLLNEQVPGFTSAYGALRDSVYSALVMQTRLRPYLDAIDLVIDENGVRFETSSLTTLLNDRHAASERESIFDLVDLTRFAGSTMRTVGYPVTATLGSWIDALPANSPVRAELIAADVLGASASTGTARNDIYLGGSAANTFSAGAGDDILDGGAGNDVLQGDAGDDVLDGGGGADSVQGGEGNDSLSGGADNDSLHGEAGNDVLDGGAGNDSLFGNTGADVYLFGTGSGQDTAYNYDADALGTNADTIQLGAGITPVGVTLTRSGEDLLISLNGGSDSLRVPYYFANDGASGSVVESLRFADGTTWDVATVKARVLLPTAGNDTITGYASNDILSGGDGNDALYGQAGDDVLDGGAGADYMQGDDGNDTLKGGADADRLYGGTGADTLQGDAGNDSAFGEDGNDVIDGGAGNDILGGGAGADVYLFGAGSGQDFIGNYDADALGTNADTIQLGAGITAADVRLTRSGEDLLISLTGSSDSSLVTYYFASEGASNFVVDNLRFADGTTWDVATVKAQVLLPTAGNDTITGYATNDVLNGGDGNDVLYGQAGDDVLDGGAGADNVQGGDGNDMVNGGASNDSLGGWQGDDLLDGGAGNDLLYGGGNDTWNGIFNGWGNDTYRFGRGAGQDTIVDYNYVAGAEIDTIEIAAGALPSDVTVVRVGNDLNLAINGSSDSIRVGEFFSADSNAGFGHIEQVRFLANGTVWSAAALMQMVLVSTAGNDTLIGSTAADTLSGGDGDDTIYGRSGNDTLGGNAGNDLLVGESGDDALDGGDGNDALYGDSGNDVLNGGDGTDGLNGGDGSDSLLGGAGNDTLSGWQGDDLLDGGAGNDMLYGGANDHWNGILNGYGSDIYRFGRGAGQDTIIDYNYVAGAETDTIEIAAGVLPSEVTVVRVGNDLSLAINGTSDSVRVRDFFTNATDAGFGHIEQVRFLANGTVWSAASLTQMVLVSTAGNDTLIGSTTADTLSGGDGDDTIYGRSGNDTLGGNAGNDTLLGETGDDALDGGDGNDGLYGDAGNDVLDGGAGTDNVQGGDGNDSLSGGTANDTMQGGNGDDILDGGAGNDLLAGGIYDTWNGYYSGYGSDTYRFGAGGGQDTVSDRNGAVGEIDTIELAIGVGASDVQLLRVNSNDLALELVGTTDRITVSAHFNGANAGDGAVEQIRFADGTVWDASRIAASVLSTIQGTVAAETLNGGAGADRLLGLDGNDTLNGNAGHDWLDGGLGADALRGGAGDDVYVVDNTADTITENASEGADTVRSAVTLTLGANVEHLVLTGTAAINGTGNALNNDLYGNSGINALAGGAGNDFYYVGAGDTVTEGASAGTDTVYSTTTWTLGTNVEHLTLVGTVAINGTGNTLANTITGNDAANAINGGTGADTLIGGRGDDAYTVDNAGDAVTELAGQGLDSVSASIAYTLTSNVENLTLTGTSGLAGTGNDLDNVIIGNSGANTLIGGVGSDRLDGGTGIDTMTGGAGNDTFVVNVAGDVTNENANEGIDTVESLVTRTLGTNLENLTLTGTSAISGTGNTLDNVLTGNSAANTLTGGEGNDTYVGNAGNDTLNDTSTSSNEVYRWGIGQGNDTVTDAGGSDRIEIAAGVTASQMSLVRSGNNLQVKISGATDVLTVVNWYTATANRVETIALADGSVINAGTTAPLSVTALSSREWIQMERTSNAPKATFARSPNTLKLPQAVPAASAVHVVRGTQLLVQAMAQFDGNNGASDITTPVRWHDDRLHVQLATPW